MVPFDWPDTISYYSSIATMSPPSCTVFDILSVIYQNFEVT